MDSSVNAKTPSVASFSITVETDSSSPEDLQNTPTDLQSSHANIPLEVSNKTSTTVTSESRDRRTPLLPQTPKSNFSISSPLLDCSDDEDDNGISDDDEHMFIPSGVIHNTNSSFRSSVMHRRRLLLEGREETDEDCQLKDV